jgi:hypothetical protein
MNFKAHHAGQWTKQTVIDQLFLAWRMAQNTIVTLASQSNSL